MLFLFINGTQVTTDIRQAFEDTANSVGTRSTNPAIEYGLGAFQSEAEGMVTGGFGDSAALTLGATKFNSWIGSGPTSLEAPSTWPSR